MDFNLNLGSFTTDHRTVPLETERIYDVIITGGGPAAMTAAVYCMRKGVSTGFVTREIGGQVSETSGIENYLGYKYIEGRELVNRFSEQVKQFEIGFREGAGVLKIETGDVKKVAIDSGETFLAKTVIISTGNRWRKLGVPGEDRLVGKGVAYCAICDAPFFAGKRVAVVGGGNSGLEAAIDLAKVAEHVTLVQFLEHLTADGILIDKIEKYGNVDILLEHEVKEVKGDEGVTAVTVAERKTGKARDLDVQGVFVEIGLIPNSEMVKGVVDLNERGEIVVDCACRTSAPGIFAAGDVTSVPYKQIIIAAGEGAKAALSACEYILMGK